MAYIFQASRCLTSRKLKNVPSCVTQSQMLHHARFYYSQLVSETKVIIKIKRAQCIRIAVLLAGLDDGDQNSDDPASIQGAFLSFLQLRHLRIRDLQRTVSISSHILSGSGSDAQMSG